MARLKPGQGVQVTLDALPGRQYVGRVEALDSQLDANGRSLLVRAQLTKPAASCAPACSRASRVVFDVREGALVVPEEALVPHRRASSTSQAGRRRRRSKVAQRIEARIGLRVPGKVEILEG